MFEGVVPELFALLLGSAISFAVAKARLVYLSRKRSGHLFSLYRRTGEVRVIIPAREEVAEPNGYRMSLQTTVEGMAYGWLLKAYLPLLKPNEKVECQLAHRASGVGPDVASILMGNTKSNPITAQFLAGFLPETTIESVGNSLYRISHGQESYESEQSMGLHVADYALLAFDSDQQTIACFGTSPYGVAGAVSMLVEANEKGGTDHVASRITENVSFLAVGRVTVVSETDWIFDRVVQIYSGPRCLEVSLP